MQEAGVCDDNTDYPTLFFVIKNEPTHPKYSKI